MHVECATECLLLAQNEHPNTLDQCALSGKAEMLQ
jgi:hypothetical protein